jgi:hypothetical protein
MVEALAHLVRAQGTKRVHKAYPRIELRVPGQAFLNPGHANEHHPNAPVVKDRTHLLQGRHFQAISLIDEHQGRRVGDLDERVMMFVREAHVGRCGFRKAVWWQISIPIELRKESALSFFFCHAFLLADSSELHALRAFEVFDP